jgi:hypothetical protein
MVDRCEFPLLVVFEASKADGFLSPASRENRLRFPLEIIKLVRSVVPDNVVLSLRISGTEWSPQGEIDDEGEWISWGIEHSKVSESLPDDLCDTQTDHQLDVPERFSSRKLSKPESIWSTFLREVTIPNNKFILIPLTKSVVLVDFTKSEEADSLCLTRSRRFLSQKRSNVLFPKITRSSFRP